MIKVEIQGISPLLCNRFFDESTGTSSAIKSGNKGTPREQAEKKLYLDSKRQPIIPGPNIFRSIIDAGAFHKSGKNKITTMRSSLIPAGLALTEIECPILGPQSEPAWEVDSRSVVIPSTGGRVMCHRPRFDTWRINFTLDVDNGMFTNDLVRQIVDDAGKRIGLGDFRPARKGPFGRFQVTLWRPEKN